MSRRPTSISRNVQKFIYTKKQRISFKAAYLTNGSKIILFWIIICGVSLFLPWVTSMGGITAWSWSESQSFSSFSWVLWRVGVLIFFLLSCMSFSILSIAKKEKIRFFLLMNISDTLLCLCSSLIIFFLCIQSYLFIGWLQIFSSNILYGKWIILCMTGAIILFIGSIIIRQEYRKNIKWSYISELSEPEKNQDTTESKDNMKLPF